MCTVDCVCIVPLDYQLLFDLSRLMLVLVNSQDRNLREKMYMTYITRASQGDADNSEIIEEIRRLRYVYLVSSQLQFFFFGDTCVIVKVIHFSTYVHVCFD